MHRNASKKLWSINLVKLGVTWWFLKKREELWYSNDTYSSPSKKHYELSQAVPLKKIHTQKLHLLFWGSFFLGASPKTTQTKIWDLSPSRTCGVPPGKRGEHFLYINLLPNFRFPNKIGQKSNKNFTLRDVVFPRLPPGAAWWVSPSRYRRASAESSEGSSTLTRAKVWERRDAQLFDHGPGGEGSRKTPPWCETKTWVNNINDFFE